jgi:hypothetical protein
MRTKIINHSGGRALPWVLSGASLRGRVKEAPGSRALSTTKSPSDAIGLSRVKPDLKPLVIQDRLIKKWSMAWKIRREEGLLAMLKSCILSAIEPVYVHASYYLYENPIDLTEIESNLAKHKPKIDESILNFRVVDSNRQADELEEEGFEFRSYPYIFSHDTNYKKMLDDGLIGFCTFVGKEFAAITWVIPSQQAQDRFKPHPLKVDYLNHQAYPRAAWCNPKYRGLGITRYTFNNRDLYLAKMGIRMLRSADDYRNKAGYRLSHAMGDKQCGQAVFLKILCWKFWKERLD